MGTLEHKIPFLGVDTVVLDGDQTKPVLVNRDPEPMEVGVPVESDVYLEIVNFDFDGISVQDTKVWIDKVLVFDGSSYDGVDPDTVQKPGFSCEWVLTDDTLSIRIDPDVDFVSLNRTNVRVVSRTTDPDHPGVMDANYSFTVEDRTSPVVQKVVPWGQKLVQVHFGQPLVQKDLDIVSVECAFNWGRSVLEWDTTLRRWVKNDLTYPYSASGTGPFAMKHLDTFTVKVDDEDPVTVRLLGSSFVDKDNATASEVATALDVLLDDCSTWENGGRVYVRSNNPSGSVQVTGGTSSVELGFSTERFGRRLPYHTPEDSLGVRVFTTYSDGRVAERVGLYEFENTDERFVLEPVPESVQSDEALDPANYSIERINDDLTPTATVNPVSARSVDSTIVELELDVPMTPGSPYRLRASTDIVDSNGNPITPPNDFADFEGWSPPVPERRRLDLYEMLPKINRTRDSSKDLFRVMKTLQEPLNLVLYDVDRFPDTWNPQKATIDFVDAILFDLGNPFGWVGMDDSTKRRLVWNLVSIYKLKGTAPGIQAVLRFFLGIDSVVRPFTHGEVWDLAGVDDSTLEVVGDELFDDDEEEGGTILGMDDRRARFTFDVEIVSVNGVHRVMTEEEEETARKLIDYMKGAHEHFGRFIQPTEEEVTEGWVLDVTELAGVSDETGEIEGDTVLMEEEDDGEPT